MSNRRRRKIAAKREPNRDPSNPLVETCYFEDLPKDIQQVVYQGVCCRVTRTDMWRDLENRFINLGLVRDEIADDRINRNNSKKTIKEWLEFAEGGQEQ